MRQKILKAVYPLLTRITRLTGTNSKVHMAPGSVKPPVSFYSMLVPMNNGKQLSLETLRNKKILLVNTASDCGYTAQYEELQQLQEMFKERLVIIGFPANDFKEQEKGTDEEIAEFCKINYGVTFPLAQKSSVIKGPQQNEVFRWLSDPGLNGWNKYAPVWNFSKYLVSAKGDLLGYFEPSVSPTGTEIITAVETLE